jgi:hypothetical protein
VPPPDQRLEPADTLARQLHAPLVIHHELLFQHRPAQIVLQLQLLRHARIHLRRVEQILVARALGVLQRRLGILEQALGVRPVRRIQRHTRARRDAQVASAQRIRPLRGAGEDLLEKVDHIGRTLGTAAGERKVIAAHVGEDVGLPERGLQPRGERPQELVARLAPEGIVDVPEALDVEHHDGEHVPVAPRRRHALLQPVLEQRAVGQPRQHVVIREVA